MDLLGPLIHARRRVSLVSQVVHGDLPGNVMFADGLPPAIIDWPPDQVGAYRPVIDLAIRYVLLSE